MDVTESYNKLKSFVDKLLKESKRPSDNDSIISGWKKYHEAITERYKQRKKHLDSTYNPEGTGQYRAYTIDDLNDVNNKNIIDPEKFTHIVLGANLHNKTTSPTYVVPYDLLKRLDLIEARTEVVNRINEIIKHHQLYSKTINTYLELISYLLEKIEYYNKEFKKGNYAEKENYYAIQSRLKQLSRQLIGIVEEKNKKDLRNMISMSDINSIVENVDDKFDVILGGGEEDCEDECPFTNDSGWIIH
jgi:hypothetical protein